MQLLCFVQFYLVGAPCGLFDSLEWHVVDGRARSDDVPTGRSTCISSVLDRAQGVEGQLVIMPFIVDEGHQPHVRVLAWCFSGAPVACQSWHSLNAVRFLRWPTFTELIDRCAIPSVGDLPPTPVTMKKRWISGRHPADQCCDSIGDVNGKPCAAGQMD